MPRIFSYNWLQGRRLPCSLPKWGLCLLVLGLLAGCDPDGKKECDWTLEPEQKLEGTTDPGYIPVCARNRVTDKQDCRLQAKLEFAEKAYRRKFRYVDLRTASAGIPRTVTDIKFCDGK